MVAPDDSIQAGDTTPLDTANCERTVLTRKTVVLADIPEQAPDLAARPDNQQLGGACYPGAPVEVDGEVHGTFWFYGSEPRVEPFSEWEVTGVETLPGSG